MAAPVYATVAELAGAMDPDKPPADAARMLRDASGDIDDLLLCAVYATGPAGAPADPDVIEALREATIALVRYRIDVGDDGGGAMEMLTSASLAGVSMSWGGGGKGKPSVRYGPRVPGILQRAGLLGQSPWQE